jgi:cytochrome b6-f complex iron-sulfur subunit
MNAMPTRDPISSEGEPPVNEPLNRREFFDRFRKGVVLLTGAVAVGEAAQMAAHPTQPKPAGRIAAGQPSEYTVPGLTFMHDAKAYLGRDSLGFYAIDAVCPHLGCIVKYVGDSAHPASGDGFICPCHNSQYAADGSLEHGPATRGLRYLEVELDASEHLVIHRDREAHPSDRLVV